MSENKGYGLEEMEAAGYEIGLMIGAIVRGALRGLADYEAQNAALEPADQLVERDEPAPPLEKTRLADCRACWCDTCAAIMECENIRPGFQPDGETPLPCVGCYDGARCMPQDNPPTCGGYIALEGGGVNNG